MSDQYYDQMMLFSKSLVPGGIELDMDHKLIKESMLYPRDIIRFLDLHNLNVDPRGQEPIDAVNAFMILICKRKFKVSDRRLFDMLGTDIYVQAFCGFTKLRMPGEICARSNLPGFYRRFPTGVVNMINEIMAGGTPAAAADDDAWADAYGDIFDEANDGLDPEKIPDRKVPDRKYLLYLCKKERDRIERLKREWQEDAINKAEKLKARLTAFKFEEAGEPVVQYMLFGEDPDLIYVPSEDCGDIAQAADSQEGTEPLPHTTDSQGEAAPDPEAADSQEGTEPVPDTTDSQGEAAPDPKTADSHEGTEPLPNTTDSQGEAAPDPDATLANGSSAGTEGTGADGKNAGNITTDPDQSLAEKPVEQKHYLVRDVILIDEILPFCSRLQIPVEPTTKIVDLCGALQEMARPPFSQDVLDDVYILLLHVAYAMSRKIRNYKIEDAHDDDIEALGEVAKKFIPFGDKAIMDATVAPSNIAYPTDANLLNHARLIVENLIHKIWVQTEYLRDKSEQELPYLKTDARDVHLSLVKDKSLWTREKMRPIVGKLLDYLGRALDRFMELRERFSTIRLRKHTEDRIPVILKLLEQQTAMYVANSKRCPDRIVSIYQPFVRPIVRGKQRNPTEFGQKLHLMDVGGTTLMLRTDWNNYTEGTELPAGVEHYYKVFHRLPVAVLADLAYKTRVNRIFCRCLGIRFTGRLRRQKEADAAKADAAPFAVEDARERSIIEGRNGTLKVGYGLDKVMCINDPFQRTSAALSLVSMNATNMMSQILRKERELERAVLNGRRRPYRKTPRRY